MIKEKMKQLVGKSIKAYNNEYSKPKIDELKFKEQYQGRIIDCMVGEVDDDYIETPETDNPIVKLEHSKEGVVKIPSIKGKTILVDAEGNETDTPGEGCRLISVGESEDNRLLISSKNKNLFNGKYTFDRWDNKVTEHIYIKGLTSISHSTTSMNDGALISTSRFYDKNKNLIKDNGNTWNNRKLDIPNGAEYIQHSIKPTVDINTFMIESSSIVTNYVPHQSHKTEILLDEPLRSLPNGVCDEIIGNKLIRRVGYYVLNEKVFNIGSENAGWTPQIQTIPFYKYCDQFSPQLDVKKVSVCFSNILKSTGSFVHVDKEGIGFSSGNPNASYIGGRLNRDRISKQDGYEVAKLLNGTQIQYELAEPIVEELPNGITLQGFDDTTMYIENSITPTVTYGYNALIPYKQELLNQKEEVETNTLDIENNIVPYLMDMEYNLMLMEDN